MIRGDTGFMDQGACRTTNPNVFFPETKDASCHDAALRICEGCPVRHECLTFALDGEEKIGVWGGTTPADRRKIWNAGRPVKMECEECGIGYELPRRSGPQRRWCSPECTLEAARRTSIAAAAARPLRIFPECVVCGAASRPRSPNNTCSDLCTRVVDRRARRRLMEAL